MSTLGARLRAERERNKLTQVSVAKQLGITNVQLSRYESDIHKPDPETLAKIAQLYEVSSDYLIGIDSSRFDKLGQRSQTPRDNLPIEYSDNRSTIESTPSPGSNSPYSQKVINLADERMKQQDMRDRPDGDNNVSWLPVLGTIKAGYDLYADQQVIDVQPVATSDIADGAEYFFLVVTGDSMIEEGIREGMRVLVRRQEYVEDGKIAVVLVNGDEATLKRVVSKDGDIILLASNHNYPPRTIPKTEVRIQGQVKQVVWDV